MGQVLVDSDSLTAIGDAIRKKTNQVIKYKPAEMPAAINSINSLKLGGYKVNITQSDHQTIHVVQSTFSDQESGFTIEDHPTINISLTADPGYKAGNLNRTTFTFSNDVREVDIFATAATAAPNITYNGNMNVFLAQVPKGDMFSITTGTKKDIIANGGYVFNEAFALALLLDDDMPLESLIVNYKNNFYNLDPNCKYKITTLKIGDTSLSETDISDGDPNIPCTTDSTYAYINADISKDWVKSVYRQCTGKEITSSTNFPAKMDILLQNDAQGCLGQQIAERLYEQKTVESAEINNLIPDDESLSPFFITLPSDKRSEFADSIDFFMTSYKTNTTGLKDGNLVQNYFNVLKQLQDQYANDTTATSILKKYEPFENNDFKQLLVETPDIVKIIYNIDPSNTYGFASSLNGGLAYVLWLFYAYYVVIMLMDEFSGFFGLDTPIISTIPVSITFTNVSQ